MTQIQAVVFDFAGVLVGGKGSQEARWARAARQVGMDASALMDFLCEGEAYHRMQEGAGSRQAWWAERMARLSIEEGHWEELHEQLFDTWAPNPDCVEMVEALHGRGVRLALLSNGGGTEAVMRARYAFLAPFDAILLSGEVGVAKPSTGAFHAVERALLLPPSALLLVDDLPNNVAAARRAGWQGHCFDGAELLRRELEAWSLL